MTIELIPFIIGPSMVVSAFFIVAWQLVKLYRKQERDVPAQSPEPNDCLRFINGPSRTIATSDRFPHLIVRGSTRNIAEAKLLRLIADELERGEE